MSCVGCEAIFYTGEISLFTFGAPNLWKVGWDIDEDSDFSPVGEAALQTATGQKVVAPKGSGQSFSSHWFDPESSASDEFMTSPYGFRFNKNTPADHSAGEPDVITVAPLRYSVNLVDGVCSPSGGYCITGASCRALIELTFQITNTIIDDDGITKLPNAQQPASAAVSDPNVEAQNIQISYGTGFGASRTATDGLGRATDDLAWNHHRTQIMTVTFFIEPEACGQAASWNTNLADWTLFFTGYTMETLDQNDQHPDGDWYMAVYCEPCQLPTQPGGGPGGLGSQGGGKNQNPNSINS
jgi:hypothetical protein